MKLRFLIAAPPYSHQSAGIMVLHQLCDMLNRQGYEAAMVFFHGGSKPHFQWAYTNNPGVYHPDLQRVQLSMDNPDKSIRDFLENGVLIYPDLIPDNPLAASRVVRYLMYHNHDYTPIYPNEYILSFSQTYHSNPNMTLYKVFSDENLHANGSLEWSERTMDLTYFGKGPTVTDCFRIPETLMISRTWPEDKNQLGILLRQCRYFFTWDSMSATNIDAVSCGAVPVLLHERQTTRDELNQGELSPYPNIMLMDLRDKESLIGDKAEISRQLNEMKNAILFYDKSWPERVRQFAVDASRFYQID